MRPATCHPDRPHKSRGLCKRCYNRACEDGRLDSYPLRIDTSMEVDEVVVDRAVEWAIRTYNTTTNQQRKSKLPSDRPRLTRGEKIEAMRKAERSIPRSVAACLLGARGLQEATR